MWWREFKKWLFGICLGFFLVNIIAAAFLNYVAITSWKDTHPAYGAKLYYPLTCPSEKNNGEGTTFIVKKSQEMNFRRGDLIVPENLFYFLLPIHFDAPYRFTNGFIIRYSSESINLANFLDREVCIRGRYKNVNISSFIKPELLPEVIRGSWTVVVDIKEINLVSH
jgi:hypothetical protein